VKYTPIKKPEKYSPVILDKGTMLDTGFGETVLKLEYHNTPEIIEISYIGGVDRENFPTVADWEKKYRTLIDSAETATIWINKPLYDELYELNKEDGEWYLVKKGMGFA
jgi:hypothetical protein